MSPGLCGRLTCWNSRQPPSAPILLPPVSLGWERSREAMPAGLLRPMLVLWYPNLDDLSCIIFFLSVKCNYFYLPSLAPRVRVRSDTCS